MSETKEWPVPANPTVLVDHGTLFDAIAHMKAWVLAKLGDDTSDEASAPVEAAPAEVETVIAEPFIEAVDVAPAPAGDVPADAPVDAAPADAPPADGSHVSE